MLDRVERLAKSQLLRPLACLRELIAATAGGEAANIAVVMISQLSWCTGVLMAHSIPEPEMLHCSHYSRHELMAILALDRPVGATPELYRMFLDTVVLQHFMRLSRTVTDLGVVAQALWPKYVQPGPDGKLPQPQQRRDFDALFSRVRDHVRWATETFEPGDTALQGCAGGAGQFTAGGDGGRRRQSSGSSRCPCQRPSRKRLALMSSDSLEISTSQTHMCMHRTPSLLS